MSLYDVKMEFISRIKSRDVWYKDVDNVRLRTRCPYCGDSKKNKNTGHLYIYYNPNEESPILCKCFKCDIAGVIDKELTEALGIYDDTLWNEYTNLKRGFISVENIKYTGIKGFRYFDMKLPEVNMNNPKLKYIEDRLGIKLNKSDISKFKIVTSLKDFLNLNNITKYTQSIPMVDILDRDFIGFLSYGNSHLILRDLTNRYDKMKWTKYTVSKLTSDNSCFYSINQEINIFDNREYTVNITEGIMDILSVYKNLGQSSDTCCNFANCGKNYNRLIEFLISKGVYGDCVTINIYSDNDSKFNKTAYVEDTTIGYYRKTFKKYKHLFKAINIYYNILDKDCGVPKSQIKLKKYSI